MQFVLEKCNICSYQHTIYIPVTSPAIGFNLPCRLYLLHARRQFQCESNLGIETTGGCMANPLLRFLMTVFIAFCMFRTKIMHICCMLCTMNKIIGNEFYTLHFIYSVVRWRWSGGLVALRSVFSHISLAFQIAA